MKKKKIYSIIKIHEEKKRHEICPLLLLTHSYYAQIAWASCSYSPKFLREQITFELKEKDRGGGWGGGEQCKHEEEPFP